ncbi:MAG: LPS export ABC transporter periplasmic protein LptC [Bacteroidota bacterium]|jgi:LPS export ABC transporter protein LptC
MTNRFIHSAKQKATRFIFLKLVAFCMLCLSCTNSKERIKHIKDYESLQEDRASDVTILYSEKALVKANLFASEFVRNENARPPFTELRKKVRVFFYDDQKKIKSTLYAKYARMYEHNKNVIIRDSIVVINQKGEQLKTEELVWNEQLRKFFTNKPVQIKTATQMIYGNGLEANEDFSYYQITQIKGIVNLTNNSEL